MSLLRNLQVRVLLSALIPGSAILIVVAIIAMYAYGGTMLDVVSQRDAELARLTAGRLSDGLNRLTGVLEEVALEPTIRQPDMQQARFALDAKSEDLIGFDAGVTFYDVGLLPAWTSRQTTLPAPPPSPIVETLAEVQTSMDRGFSDVFVEPTTGRDAIAIAVPVIDRKGDYAGAMVGVATLNGSVMSAMLSDSLDVSPGDAGLTYLVDGSGRSIFHGRPELVGQDFTQYPPVAELSDGSSGADLSRSPTGERVISGFSPVPGTDWGVVTQQLWSDVEGPIRNSSMTMLGLLVFGAVVASGGIWFFIGKALRPVRELNAGAQRIASGDFDHQIVANSGDEVQQLAEQFNVMAEALKSSYSELEERVEQRTRELAESEERVRAAAEELQYFYAQEQRRAAQFRAVREIGMRISTIFDIDELLTSIGKLDDTSLGYELTAVGIVDGDELVFLPSANPQLESPVRRSLIAGSDNQGITGLVAATGEPVIVPDVKLETRYKAFEQAPDIRSSVTVPIVAGGQTIGVLHSQSRRPNAFDEADQLVLQALAQEIGIAIENAHVFQEQQARAEFFRVIAELGSQMSASLDLEALLSDTVKLIQGTFGYYHVGIGLIERDDVVYKYGAGRTANDTDFKFEPARLRIGAEGLTGWVANAGEPLMVSDVDREPRYVAMRHLNTKSELTIPIRAKGEVIGVLDLQSDRPNDFDDADLIMLQSLANEAGVAIENARIYEAERRQNHQMAAINAVALNVSAVLTLGELLPHVVQLVRETFGYHTVGVFLVDDSEEAAVLQAVDSADNNLPVRGTRLAIGSEGIVGRVAGTGLPWISPDITTDPFYSTLSIETAQTKSELAMPIKQGDLVVGVLDLHSAEYDAFDDTDMLIAQTLANQLAVAIENARIFDETRDLTVLEERNRMAREIHDTLAQGFTGIVIQLEAGEESMEQGSGDLRQHISTAKSLARECLAEARRSVWNLLPEALEESTLEAILSQEVERFNGIDGANAKFTLLGSRRHLTPLAQAALLRICQESLTNIYKYASAGDVEVKLDFALDSVILTVTDDGIGFDPDAVRIEEGGGFGLTGMRQRARLLQGDVSIQSVPGEGTTVQARIPTG